MIVVRLAVHQYGIEASLRHSRATFGPRQLVAAGERVGHSFWLEMLRRSRKTGVACG
jgi:hypothetical protein